MYTWATFYTLCREIRIYLIHASQRDVFCGRGFNSTVVVLIKGDIGGSKIWPSFLMANIYNLSKKMKVVQILEMRCMEVLAVPLMFYALSLLFCFMALPSISF